MIEGGGEAFAYRYGRANPTIRVKNFVHLFEFENFFEENPRAILTLRWESEWCGFTSAGKYDAVEMALGLNKGGEIVEYLERKRAAAMEVENHFGKDLSNDEFRGKIEMWEAV